LDCFAFDQKLSLGISNSGYTWLLLAIFTDTDMEEVVEVVGVDTEEVFILDTVEVEIQPVAA